MSELLPDGAWLVAGMDFDTSGSVKQKQAEDKARTDPSSIKKPDGGCQIPATHAAFAVYDRQDFAFATRGSFVPDAMIDCLAESNASKGKTSHATIAGHDVLVTQTGNDTPFMYVASETGVLVMAHEPVMNRVLAQDLRPATTDPRLASLVAQARAGGEIWAAGRLPRSVPVIDDVLSALSVKLAGHVTSFTAAIHFTAPFKIVVELELEQAADAQLLATALEQKKKWLGAVNSGLKPIADSLAIHADGTHVQVLGTPAHVDWLQAFQGLLAAIAMLRDHQAP